MSTENNIPWYKNYILLLIIFIPLATVCGSMVTIYLAVESREAPVLEDYFKVGLSPQKQKFAPTTITALLDVNAGVLTVNRPEQSIEPLKLLMQHATKAEFDETFTLNPTAPNIYPLPAKLRQKFPQATWYFYLTPLNGHWRIEGERKAPKHGHPEPAHEKNILLQQW